MTREEYRRVVRDQLVLTAIWIVVLLGGGALFGTWAAIAATMAWAIALAVAKASARVAHPSQTTPLMTAKPPAGELVVWATVTSRELVGPTATTTSTVTSRHASWRRHPVCKAVTLTLCRR